MLIHTNTYLKLIDFLAPLIAMLSLLPLLGEINGDLYLLALLAGVGLVLYSSFFEYYYNYYV